ncbi:unnamed protein product [Caretta caretta]
MAARHHPKRVHDHAALIPKTSSRRCQRGPRHRCRDGKAAKLVQQEEILSGNLVLPAADYYVYSKYEETFWITQCIIPSYQLVVFQLLTTSFNFLDVCIAPVWHEENTLLLISCGYLQRE